MALEKSFSEFFNVSRVPQSSLPFFEVIYQLQSLAILWEVNIKRGLQLTLKDLSSKQNTTSTTVLSLKLAEPNAANGRDYCAVVNYAKFPNLSHFG